MPIYLRLPKFSGELAFFIAILQNILLKTAGTAWLLLALGYHALWYVNESRS